MSLWMPVVVATAGAFALKFAGYVLPDHLMEHPRFSQVARLLPIGLLSGLIAVQSLGDGQAIVLDGRLVGVAVAVAMLLRRMSFIYVVITAAAVTAIGRHFGLWV